MYEYEHKQVKVMHPKYGPIEVDEGIAELLKCLWQLNIATSNSCQENQNGIMWIDFDSSRDVEIFLNSLFYNIENRKGKLKMLHENVIGVENYWNYSVCLMDMNEDFENDCAVTTWPVNYDVSISLRFPITDYKLILKTIKEYLNIKVKENV